MELELYKRIWKCIALNVALKKQNEYVTTKVFYTDGCTTYVYKDEDTVISIDKNKLYDMLLSDGFTIKEIPANTNDIVVRFKISREAIINKASGKKKGL